MVTQTPTAPATAPTPGQNQELLDAEKELIELLNRKKQVDKALSTLESNLYTYEGSYLEDTQQHGNIIKGFDGYLSSRNDKRKMKFNDSDRIFSMSSVTYMKSLEMRQREELLFSEEDGGRAGSPMLFDRSMKKRSSAGGDRSVLNKKFKKRIRSDDE
ncbi:Chromatin modification- protein meaf6 [Dinochytrium kinnereticum]|nr:Chromatin modification- protein meaf6 [Dinochytrium kinnereticum]